MTIALGVFFNRSNQQLKKLKNRMFDYVYGIWYNIITEGASEMNHEGDYYESWQ